MAFNVNRSVAWRGGVGTPEKYVFNLNVTISVVSVVNNIATIRMTGTYGVQNNPTNSRNSFAASDYAILSKGDVDPWNYGFTPGVSYYQSGLPMAPNAPQSVVDGILIEFRGDTWRNDPNNSNNRSTLYAKPSGVVLNTYDGSVYQNFSIDTTFTVDISAGGNVPVLTWVTSGTDSATDYGWLEHEVWASWFDLDYRPGALFDGTRWLSHNRSGGECHVFNGSSYKEMRTVGGPTAMGNPPSVFYNNKWYNMNRTGYGA